MKVTLVARVSTTKQDADLRMNELRQWSKLYNHIIVDEHWVYESATIDIEKRKEFMSIFENPKGDAIVLNKLDRLTRNYKSISWFEDYFIKKGDSLKLIALDIVPDFKSSVGRFLFRSLLTVACLEAEQMKERAAPAIAKRKAEGKFKGRQKGAKGKATSSKRQWLNLMNAEVN